MSEEEEKKEGEKKVEAKDYHSWHKLYGPAKWAKIKLRKKDDPVKWPVIVFEHRALKVKIWEWRDTYCIAIRRHIWNGETREWTISDMVPAHDVPILIGLLTLASSWMLAKQAGVCMEPLEEYMTEKVSELGKKGDMQIFVGSEPSVERGIQEARMVYKQRDGYFRMNKKRPPGPKVQRENPSWDKPPHYADAASSSDKEDDNF